MLARGQTLPRPSKRSLLPLAFRAALLAARLGGVRDTAGTASTAARRWSERSSRPSLFSPRWCSRQWRIAVSERSGRRSQRAAASAESAKASGVEVELDKAVVEPDDETKI